MPTPNETIKRRMLFVVAGLIILGSLILPLFVIPSVRADATPGATPERAVPAMWVIVIIQLVFVATLIKVIFDNQRRGEAIPNGLLIGTGVVLIILSLVLYDGASAYLGHGPGMHKAAISMLICIGCDFFAAVTAFVSLFLKARKTVLKESVDSKSEI